jgi:hypothetical protein
MTAVKVLMYADRSGSKAGYIHSMLDMKLALMPSGYPTDEYSRHHMYEYLPLLHPSIWYYIPLEWDSSSITISHSQG